MMKLLITLVVISLTASHLFANDRTHFRAREDEYFFQVFPQKLLRVDAVLEELGRQSLAEFVIRFDSRLQPEARSGSKKGFAELVELYCHLFENSRRVSAKMRRDGSRNIVLEGTYEKDEILARVKKYKAAVKAPHQVELRDDLMSFSVQDDATAFVIVDDSMVIVQSLGAPSEQVSAIELRDMSVREVAGLLSQSGGAGGLSKRINDAIKVDTFTENDIARVASPLEHPFPPGVSNGVLLVDGEIVKGRVIYMTASEDDALKTELEIIKEVREAHQGLRAVIGEGPLSNALKAIDVTQERKTITAQVNGPLLLLIRDAIKFAQVKK